MMLVNPPEPYTKSNPSAQQTLNETRIWPKKKSK